MGEKFLHCHDNSNIIYNIPGIIIKLNVIKLIGYLVLIVCNRPPKNK